MLYLIEMEEETSFKSLKDLLLTIVEDWERNDCVEVREVAQQTRKELETAGENKKISEQYCSPDLSSSPKDPLTEEIFQRVL